MSCYSSWLYSSGSNILSLPCRCAISIKAFGSLEGSHAYSPPHNCLPQKTISFIKIVSYLWFDGIQSLSSKNIYMWPMFGEKRIHSMQGGVALSSSAYSKSSTKRIRASLGAPALSVEERSHRDVSALKLAPRYRAKVILLSPQPL
jgi:hypothetical protein